MRRKSTKKKSSITTNSKRTSKKVEEEFVVPEDNNLMEEQALTVIKKNSMDYYEDILYHRGIPNIFDGLTDVQRRIIYTLYDKKWDWTRPHVKSARVVGEVIGRFHPHSQDAAYLTLASMSQSWKNFITMIDFHGGNGFVANSRPAQMRYTEARMDKIANKLFMDSMKSNCYDILPNYSQDETEPAFLPVKLPLLLINGSFGIAAGYMCSIAPHHPLDVIDGLIKKVKNPDADINILPCYPAKCKIINEKAVEVAYSNLLSKENQKTGIIVRCTMTHDEKKHWIIIDGIQYGKSSETIVKSIVESAVEKEDPLHKGKKIPPKINGIKKIRDTSSNNKVNIVVEVKKDYDLNLIEEQLYQFTACQDTMPLRILGNLKEGKFKEFKNVTEIFEDFIEFRRVTIRKIKLDIIKNKNYRIHILEGLFIILDDTDNVIAKIRECSDRSEVMSMLMEDYSLTEPQATYIADYKLYRLASLEINKLVNEHENLQREVEDELLFFKNPEILDSYMINEWKELRLLFKNSPRLTQYDNIEIKKGETNLATIPDEDFLFIATKNGYVKKFAPPASQNRNTKGISVGALKDNDYIISTQIVNSRDTIFIATESGIIFSLNVYDIPMTNRNTLGYNISHLINNETIVNVLPVYKSDIPKKNMYFLLATKYNKVKLVSVSEFTNMRKSGLIGITLYEGDSLLSFQTVNTKECKAVYTLNNFGNAICIPIDKIPVSKRPTYGANLFYSGLAEDGGEVVSCKPLRSTKDYFFICTQNGLGKRMETSEFRWTNRGTKGVLVCKLREDDIAIAMDQVNEDDELIIVSNKKLVSLRAGDISIYKRPTYGLKIKDNDEDEFVIDVSVK